jgi:hypothetical protein
LINKRPSKISLIFLISFSLLLLLSGLMTGLDHESVFGSPEITRTYEKTMPSPSSESSASIHRSLRNLESINELISSEDNITYRFQIDEEGRQVINVTIIDYAGPTTSPRITADNCGDGSNVFTTYDGDLRWMEFPIVYAVNPANSGVPPSSTVNAVAAAFNHFDTRMPGQAFLQSTDLESADIIVRWQFLDGQGNQLGVASFSFIPSTSEIVSASITLDSGDSWFVASNESCGQNGNLFDIQNVGSHELGHAVGLQHVNDDLLTMFPSSFAGETLKRTLGSGDRNGLSFLYGNVQGVIGSLTARPTNNIVNTNSFYDVVFLTGTSGAIKTIQVTFPAGTTIPAGAFFNEAEGIGPGTASKSGQTITYTVTNAVNVPAGTKIRLELANINNPLSPSANYKVTVTTRNAANTPIDGPTPSTAYTMKQIGTNVIADKSITSSKPNVGFMKKVILSDDEAGHARGWDPDGVSTQFSILESAITQSGAFTSFASIFAIDSLGVTPDNHFCNVVRITPSAQTFTVVCSTPPSESDQLHYVIENLPPHTP